MKSNLITKKETAILLNVVSAKWDMTLPKIKNLKVHYITNNAQLITGNELKILKIDQEFIPFLSEINLLKKFPCVIVDMGAVKFMCNGANVMRPGIKNYSKFEKDDIVCIVEESQHKFLAVGKALMSSDELNSIEKGEILKNLHYISDKFWDVGKSIQM